MTLIPGILGLRAMPQRKIKETNKLISLYKWQEARAGGGGLLCQTNAYLSILLYPRISNILLNNPIYSRVGTLTSRANNFKFILKKILPGEFNCLVAHQKNCFGVNFLSLAWDIPKDSCREFILVISGLSCSPLDLWDTINHILPKFPWLSF